MTYADLLLHLVECLQQKEKELNHAIELIHKNNLTLDYKSQDDGK